MALTKPIPKAAMQIVEILRRDVPRPEEVPCLEVILGYRVLRWGKGGCCPLGVHPKATIPTPEDRESFPVKGATTRAIISFYRWWDRETDGLAAMDAIWPL